MSQQNQILMLVGVFILGMLAYHMLKGMCGCKLVEGHSDNYIPSKSDIKACELYPARHGNDAFYPQGCHKHYNNSYQSECDDPDSTGPCLGNSSHRVASTTSYYDP